MVGWSGELTNWGCVCSTEGVVLVCGGEDMDIDSNMDSEHHQAVVYCHVGKIVSGSIQEIDAQ